MHLARRLAHDFHRRIAVGAVQRPIVHDVHEDAAALAVVEGQVRAVALRGNVLAREARDAPLGMRSWRYPLVSLFVGLKKKLFVCVLVARATTCEELRRSPLRGCSA